MVQLQPALRTRTVAGAHPDLRDAAAWCLAALAADGASGLAGRLYANWYAAGGGRSELAAGVSLPADFPADLVAVLRAAHAGGARWEDGWTVDRVGPGGMAGVVRDGELRVIYRSDYVVPARPGLQARAGDAVHVIGRRDIVDADGAWWRTRGRAWSEATPPEDLIRLYWSVEIGALALLVSNLTGILDGTSAAWLLKCAADPSLHVRPDAVVLYLPRLDLAAMTGDFDRVRSAMAPHVRAIRPPFTLPVGPGLAVAQDPGRGESFGEHRCRLVAEAILESEPSAEAATQAIAERFAADGMDPERPWRRGPAELPWEGS